MKQMALANVKSTSSSGNPRQDRAGFVLCIDNDAYPVSLEIGKVYRTLPQRKNMMPGWLRVIDESGEDYLYPAKRFVPIEVPVKARRIIPGLK